MTITQLIDCTKDVLSLLDEYTNAPHREMLIDPVIYAYFRGQPQSVVRQHRVYWEGSDRPKRIDFRFGGSNPTLVEFAVRPPIGGSQLYACANRDELVKLSRVRQSQARTRILLLIDLHHNPHDQTALKRLYARETISTATHPVRVIYVHRNIDYHFVWRP